ncbi:hypothetical protein D2E22_1677 [Bifidobacterium castoris]|uniref:Uncharacterized protein n=2 Tax=Bifidobacterium castoris TaxID=2306972 RepID=A0A430F5F1_9BIFI|nr:hypothetical protein D2E22_1677 [Bifidobacterium castoris]
MNEQPRGTSSQDDLSASVIELPGASAEYHPEGVLIVEKKDWDLIRGNLNANLERKGIKNDLFWGGLGLASGSIGGILPIFQGKTFDLDMQALVLVILFAIGIACMIDAIFSYFANRRRNEEEKKHFDEFLDRIEQQSKT